MTREGQMDDEQDQIKVFKYRPAGEHGWQIYSWDQRTTMLGMIEGDLDGSGSIYDYEEGPAFHVGVAWMSQEEFDNLPAFEGY
jgi:hypothetical protein